MNWGPPTPLTEDDLLDTLRRNFEEHWIGPLLDDPTSLSFFKALVAVVLRLQDSIDENFSRGTFILTSPGPSNATSKVRLRRPPGLEVTLDESHRFLDERGAVWRVDGQVVVPTSATEQVVDVPIRSERVGYWLNTFEPIQFQPIDPLPDPSLMAELGVDVVEGGVGSFLDLHGRERLSPRASGESDDVYRQRISTLEDLVSPTAISQTVVRVLDSWPATRYVADLVTQHGLRVVVEPFDLSQSSKVGLVGLDPIFVEDVHPALGSFLNDPGGPTLREQGDCLAWFDVVLPTPVDSNEQRRFLDDVSPTLGTFVDDVGFAHLSIPEGSATISPIAAIADELERKRAGGVGFQIYVGLPDSLHRIYPKTIVQGADDWAVTLSKQVDFPNLELEVPVVPLPGYLGSSSYIGGGSVDFEWTPYSGHSFVSVFVLAATNGILELFRRAHDSTLRPLGVQVPVTAGIQAIAEVPRSVAGSMVARFTDTSGTPGSVACETTDDGVP